MSLKYVAVALSHPHYAARHYFAADQFSGFVRGLEDLLDAHIGKTIGGELILEMIAVYNTGKIKRIPLLDYISMLYKNTRIFRNEGEEEPKFRGSRKEFEEFDDPDTLKHENFTLGNTILHISSSLMALLPFDENSKVPDKIDYSLFDSETEEESEGGLEVPLKVMNKGNRPFVFYKGSTI